MNNLKKVYETIPTGSKTYRGFEVLEEDVPEKIYIAKKDSVSFDKIEEYYTKNLPALLEVLGKSKLEIAGAPSSLYFKWDSVSKTAFIAVAVPVKGNMKTKVKGYETMAIAPGKSLHIVYQGGYKKIGEAHYAMEDYMKEKNFIQESPVIEEYVTGGDKESDSAKWVTNVYYRVK